MNGHNQILVSIIIFGLGQGMPQGMPTYKSRYKATCCLLIGLLTIAGIRFLQKYANTETFKNMGVKVIDKGSHPFCTEHKYDSDEYWECFIRHNTLTVWHPTSTCKMGKKSDKTTVVDSQLR